MLKTASPIIRHDDVSLSESKTEGLHETTSVFDIQFRGQKIGYISRGHSLIPEHRGKGYFSIALSKLEDFECDLFRSGRFPEYRDAVINQLGVGADRFKPDLESLEEPHHIEYWRYPQVAPYFLRKDGYELTRQCLLDLEEMGIEGTNEEIAEKVRERADDWTHKPTFVFVFVKKAEI